MENFVRTVECEFELGVPFVENTMDLRTVDSVWTLEETDEGPCFKTTHVTSDGVEYTMER